MDPLDPLELLELLELLDPLELLELLGDIFTAPNLPFCAVYPCFFKRFSCLALACLLAETNLPQRFIRMSFFFNPPLVLNAVPLNTCCLEPISTLYLLPSTWYMPSDCLTGRFILFDVYMYTLQKNMTLVLSFMEHGSMNGYTDFFEKRLKSLDYCDPIEFWNTSVLYCYFDPSYSGNTIELAQMFWLNVGCF